LVTKTGGKNVDQRWTTKHGKRGGERRQNNNTGGKREIPQPKAPQKERAPGKKTQARENQASTKGDKGGHHGETPQEKKWKKAASQFGRNGWMPPEEHRPRKSGGGGDHLSRVGAPSEAAKKSLSAERAVPAPRKAVGGFFYSWGKNW